MQSVAADIGNSSLNIAIAHEQQSQRPLHERELLSWNHRWSAPLDLLTPPDWIKEMPTAQWAISSVNKTGCSSLLEWIRTNRPNDRTAVLTEADVPLPSDVENRKRVGIDRLIAAWFGHQTHPNQTVIVIDAGTAVTIDLVENQAFQGGLIFPGAETMLRHLSDATDALPNLADRNALKYLGDWQNEIIGKSTEEAIIRGTYQLQTGGVIQAVEEIECRSTGLVTTIAGGGGIEDLRPGLPAHWKFIPDLVTRGALGISEQLPESRFTLPEHQTSTGAEL